MTSSGLSAPSVSARRPFVLADLVPGALVRDLLLVVGPEGGIAPNELERLGGEHVRMGPHVVRTSTAGPAAVAALAARWRW